jgi:hypothetical protein
METRNCRRHMLVQQLPPDALRVRRERKKRRRHHDGQGQPDGPSPGNFNKCPANHWIF